MGGVEVVLHPDQTDTQMSHNALTLLLHDGAQHIEAFGTLSPPWLWRLSFTEHLQERPGDRGLDRAERGHCSPSNTTHSNLGSAD